MRSVLLFSFTLAGLASQASAAEITVTMAGFAFAPAQISADVGDTIRFVNDDEVAHNVFVPTAAFATDLGTQDPGTEVSLTLRAPGEFEVECVFHPGMHTIVKVSQ